VAKVLKITIDIYRSFVNLSHSKYETREAETNCPNKAHKSNLMAFPADWGF